jgi:hypothetical protein
MHTHFVIYQGYAEDQTLACVTLSHDEGFETPEEAMEDLYGFLLARAEGRITVEPCCAKTFAEHEGARYCMVCGAHKRHACTAEDLVEEVWSTLWEGTNDSLGSEFFCDLEERGWSTEWPPGKFTVVCRFERFLSRLDGECEDDLLWFPGQ